jgi:MGT family glycosyltransferase
VAKTVFYQVPAHGHVNPSLSLASELVRRGEQVTFYITDEFKSAVEATGAAFRSYGSAYPNDMLEGIDGRPFILASRMMDACRAMVPGLMDTARAEQPDYIVFDAMAPWGWMVAKNLNLPSVSSMALLGLHPRIMLQAGLLPAIVRQSFGTFSHLRDYNRKVAALKHDLKLTAPTLMESLNAPGDITINYTSSAFQPQPELFGDSYRFVGPAMDANRPPVDFPFEQLDGRPLIFISLGTVNNEAREFYQACFEAFGGDSWQVVLSIGKRLDPATLHNIPANFIVRAYVPQLEILKRAALFITHGGMNSVQEGLYFNVPLVVIPQTDEQFLVGKQVARLGAGVLLRKGETNVTALRTAAEQVIGDPAYQTRATAVGETLRRAGGVQRAAAEILAFVKAKRAAVVK